MSYIRIYTAATPVKIKQECIFEGQIRYKITLEDVPLESGDYRAFKEAIEKGTRIAIEIREV